MNIRTNDPRDRLVGEIYARVRPTIRAVMSSRDGDSIKGEIERDDLDALVALARNPGGPIPASVAAILSRRAVT